MHLLLLGFEASHVFSGPLFLIDCIGVSAFGSTRGGLPIGIIGLLSTIMTLEMRHCLLQQIQVLLFTVGLDKLGDRGTATRCLAL